MIVTDLKNYTIACEIQYNYLKIIAKETSDNLTDADRNLIQFQHNLSCSVFVKASSILLLSITVNVCYELVLITY